MKRDRFAVELPTEHGGREGQGHDEAQEGLEVVEAEVEIVHDLGEPVRAEVVRAESDQQMQVNSYPLVLNFRIVQELECISFYNYGFRNSNSFTHLNIYFY